MLNSVIKLTLQVVWRQNNLVQEVKVYTIQNLSQPVEK